MYFGWTRVLLSLMYISCVFEHVSFHIKTITEFFCSYQLQLTQSIVHGRPKIWIIKRLCNIQLKGLKPYHFKIGYF